MGDETANVGVLVNAIFQQPEKVMGKYVLGIAEMLSCSDWASLLSRLLKENNDSDTAAFMECTLEAYETLWGHLGTEIGLMFEYFRHYGKDGYRSGVGAHSILTPEDLGVAHMMKSTEDRLRRSM